MFEIWRDESGTIDKVIAKDCNMQLEQMDSGEWCLIINMNEEETHRQRRQVIFSLNLGFYDDAQCLMVPILVEDSTVPF